VQQQYLIVGTLQQFMSSLGSPSSPVHDNEGAVPDDEREHASSMMFFKWTESFVRYAVVNYVNVW
jgi:hypothetical protein